MLSSGVRSLKSNFGWRIGGNLGRPRRGGNQRPVGWSGGWAAGLPVYPLELRHEFALQNHAESCGGTGRRRLQLVATAAEQEEAPVRKSNDAARGRSYVHVEFFLSQVNPWLS